MSERLANEWSRKWSPTPEHRRGQGGTSADERPDFIGLNNIRAHWRGLNKTSKSKFQDRCLKPLGHPSTSAMQNTYDIQSRTKMGAATCHLLARKSRFRSLPVLGPIPTSAKTIRIMSTPNARRRSFVRLGCDGAHLPSQNPANKV
jgi:hypothetical protein